MVNYPTLEATLTSALRPTRRPVGVAFLESPPPDVKAFTGTRPAGCSFWSLAAEGHAFYTAPADHYNCAIGSYTHNLPLPAERARELTETLSFMNSLGYIRMEEVPAIPRMATTPGSIVYAPLGDMPVAPDVVILTGLPSGLMTLQEAAEARGVEVHPLMGRPTCMALPAAQTGGLFTSVGCTGNRVYTDLPDGELYAVVGLDQLSEITDALANIVTANETLAAFHQNRRTELTA
jgi:uncharacterized protein (DUF169 family)